MLVAITPPAMTTGRAAALRALLAAAVGPVHLRLPTANINDHRRLLDSLTAEELGRLTVHRHPELAADYPLAGIHLPWSPEPPAPLSRTSLSVHSLAEVAAADPALRYLLLAPVFDAVSKPDRRAAFDTAELTAALGRHKAPPILALGGLTPERIDEVAALGFDGAASLGWLWADDRTSAILQRYSRLVTAHDRAFPPVGTG